MIVGDDYMDAIRVNYDDAKLEPPWDEEPAKGIVEAVAQVVSGFIIHRTIYCLWRQTFASSIF